MYDLFYITEVSPQWYNLVLKDTHYCISCGTDLDLIGQVIYRYVRKYKIKDRVYKAISGLSDRGQVSPATFKKRQEDYDSGAHLVFNSFVKEAVTLALYDNRRDTPYHQSKRKVKTVVTAVEKTTDPCSERKRSVGLKRPQKIQRTITT